MHQLDRAVAAGINCRYRRDVRGAAFRRELRQDRADRRHLAEKRQPRDKVILATKAAAGRSLSWIRGGERLRCRQPDGGARCLAAAIADGLRRSLSTSLAGPQTSRCSASGTNRRRARRHRSHDAGSAGQLRESRQGAPGRRLQRTPWGRHAFTQLAEAHRATTHRVTQNACKPANNRTYDTALAKSATVVGPAYSPLGSASSGKLPRQPPRPGR